MNLGACSSLPTSPHTGKWYRAISIRHLKTALATIHSSTVHSRFCAGRGTFEILYLAEDPVTALYEVQSLLGSPFGPSAPNPDPDNTFVTMNVRVTLEHIVDLTDQATHSRLGTTAQELTGDWRGYELRGEGPAPTQELGAAMFHAGNAEAFQTISARASTKRALVVYPEKLSGSSRVEFEYDDGTRKVRHVIP